VWSILRSAAEGYIAHGALSRGAAIAFYVATSLAPVLLIVVASPAWCLARTPCVAAWFAS
jgi:uncharacterized BrkB/YihY/UPF0761 family membrane protein